MGSSKVSHWSSHRCFRSQRKGKKHNHLKKKIKVSFIFWNEENTAVICHSHTLIAKQLKSQQQTNVIRKAGCPANCSSLRYFPGPAHSPSITTEGSADFQTIKFLKLIHVNMYWLDIEWKLFRHRANNVSTVVWKKKRNLFQCKSHLNTSNIEDNSAKENTQHASISQIVLHFVKTWKGEFKKKS